MASSSSSSHQAPAKHYDVFISYGGLSTLSNFASNLFGALNRANILTITGEEWRQKDKISSHISIIILSENYAESEWCFTELENIMESKRSNGQIVIPVFYGIDPSDVNNLTVKFGAAHASLKQRLGIEGQMLALCQIGYYLKDADRDNSGLIESIVVDIKDKLDRERLSLDYSPSLVGIASRIEHIETLLRLDLPDPRVVRIDGLGGVGKTTIANVVVRHISARFDPPYFVNNKVSMDEIVSHATGGRLRDKKILIVLDDFGVPDLVATLLPCLSGVSRILVISRDAQMLQNVSHETYTVEGLNEYDARRLLCLNAFNSNNEPTEDHVRLFDSVLEVAVGNPLALVVLGCALSGMSTEEEKKWLDDFNRLKGRLNYSDSQSMSRKEPIFFQRVLRICYDTLKDDEKKIFLQMPNFIGVDLEDVLAHFGDEVRPIVNKLEHKSLITISSDKIEMHELLREMAYSMDDRGSPAEVVVKYVFPLTNLALEGVVLILEIIGSAQKPLYSLIGLIVALSAMMVFFCELVYKGWHRNITLKWNGIGRGWWEMKRQPLDNRPFLSWSDAFSLLCAICQLVSTTVGYIYSRQDKENPFRLSLVSAIYIICMGASQIVNKSIDDVLFSKKRNE